jgi:microcompartment protein CcmK/EutM
MFLGKVIGTVVASQKHPKLQGMKLLLVQPYITKDRELVPNGSSIAAVDCVTCGTGDFVMFTQGSSARMTDSTRESPVDAVIIGIVDTVEANGQTVKKP